MTPGNTSSNSAIAEYLRQQEEKPLLRFMTCGSVDDGKSTLIGRLLHDTKLIFEDQLAALKKDSRRHGTAGDDMDYALLVDGLEAEREQGITIDVAYRFFATDKRKFIVADTPGHEEYTHNMATGASTANLAVVLLDAQQGARTQTRRHSFIASLLGIRHVILAINKMDLIGFDQTRFRSIAGEYRAFAEELGFRTIDIIPISARHGDNVAAPSQNMRWYEGPSLLSALETVAPEDNGVSQVFRFPVQYVSRPNAEFRGLAGQIAGGEVARGDVVMSAKSGEVTTIKRIVTADGDADLAGKGQAVTLVLDGELDISRGDMLASPENPPHVADQFQAHVIWFGTDPLMPGRGYILRTETDVCLTSITDLRHSIDINTFVRQAARSLARNEIGVCNFSTQTPIAFDAYKDNRSTGNFILVDRSSNLTVGAGMIDFPLRRSRNVRWQALAVTKKSRSALMNQRPCVIWFTGLSASGKSTIANSLETQLHAMGHHTILLDGDNLRHGLNRDLGFTNADRVENIRRTAEVARLMTDAGLIVIVSFISPFSSERQFAREIMAEGEFIEVFVDTPIKECIRRDPKGLYKRALAGEIENFTGIDSAYEIPQNPELSLDTMLADPETLAKRVVDFLAAR